METKRTREEAPRDVEVIVVGAGPVGLTAANFLGMYGIKTLVLERDPNPGSYPRATNVDDEALRTFQAFGLADKLMADMLANPYIRVQSDSGRVVAELRTEGTGALGFPRVCTILQPLMESTLREGMARYDCVGLRLGHKVTSVFQSPSRAGVSVRGPDGGTYTVEADYVLGCDGGRSIVRQQCDIPLNGSSSEEKWMLVEARAEPRPEGCFRFFGDLQRPMVFVQQPRGYQRWSIRLRPEDDIQEFEKLDRAGVEAMTGRWKEGPELGELLRLRTYRINTCLAERFRVGRVFLLGDSAHMMPPFAGQGLCSGLRDASNLCWKLAHVLRGKARPGLLDSYERERIPHVRESIAATQRVGWLFFPHGWYHDQVRCLALRLVSDVPPLREQFVRRSKALPALHQGLFVGQEPAGSMFIQPQVRRADGRRVLLDTVLGEGFAAIGLGVNPLDAMGGESRRLWARLGARAIRVLPEGQVPSQASGDCEEIRDEDETLSRWFAKHRGSIALVRPDRFLAAVLPRQQLAAGVQSLTGLLDA
jgi:3-(3-hydroxy-phenyl)propionate hydroxylase